MTTRRLNYTGCQRIRRADVLLTLDAALSPPRTRIAHTLDEYDFPRDAAIVLEAQAHWTVMRFDCGTIAHPAEVEWFDLTDFDSADGVAFRLKVIGTNGDAGLILGEADGVRPAAGDGVADAQAFLAVQPADLGEVAWRLSFAGAEPLLQLNERLGDWRSFMRRTEVRALLIPELYRQLLTEALANPSDSEVSESWQDALFRTVSAAAGPRPQGTDDADAVGAWVDDAVRAFAGRHKFLRGVLAWAGGEE